jgi:hypothetical protein
VLAGVVFLAIFVLSGTTVAASAPSGGVAGVSHDTADLSAKPGPAYWLAGADGGVFPFGRGGFAGALAARRTNGRVVAVVPTKTGDGYWLAGADGGVFAFGDAGFYGALRSGSTRAPIVGMASTPSGKGYWLAGADGGVFAFGDAVFHGGVSALRLNAPIAAIAATQSGRGYWLAGADGGVYAFGDALLFGHAGSVYGSAAGLHLNRPVVAMAVAPSGEGYWLAAADGAVLAFGDAPYAGGLTTQPHWGPVVGIARTRSGHGYWLATSDGGVFSFGDAAYYGSVGAAHLNGPVAAVGSGDGTAIPQAPLAPTTSLGYDISWPQCGGEVPAPPYSFGVIGVTDGHLFSTNPCLRDEWKWATSHGSFASLYVNTNAFNAAELQSFLSAGAAGCHGDVGCALYQWGRQGAQAALRAAGDLPAPGWWLDVETGNEWLPDTAANAVVLRGMIDTLRQAGKQVGIYSTSLQWGRIAGGFNPGLPTWVAGVPSSAPMQWCTGHSFGGGQTWMVQTDTGLFDPDLLCSAGVAHYRQLFAGPAPLPVPVYIAGITPTPKAPPIARALDAIGVPGPAEVKAVTWAAGHAAAAATTAAETPSSVPVPLRSGEWAWLDLAYVVLVLGAAGLASWTLRLAWRPAPAPVPVVEELEPAPTFDA